MGHETFFTLLRDKSHWEFEIFVNMVFDGFLLGIIWPFIKKHITHHLDRDRREGIDSKTRNNN
jgi:hypothetical protein